MFTFCLFCLEFFIESELTGSDKLGEFFGDSLSGAGYFFKPVFRNQFGDRLLKLKDRAGDLFISADFKDIIFFKLKHGGDVCEDKRDFRVGHDYLPWQCLYFLPEPQGQGSLRPTFLLPEGAGLLSPLEPISALAMGETGAFSPRCIRLT